MGTEISETRCRLLSVPVEIRWMVYSLIFDDMRIRSERKIPEFIPKPDYWLHLEMPPEFDILLTCRQIYDEGRPFFYEQATFNLSNLRSYDSFFDAISPTVRDHVRTVDGLKISRGVQSQLLPTMKPDTTEIDQWLTNYPNLTRISLAVDEIVTLQDERFHGTLSLDDITFDDILAAAVAPFTSTGRPRWSLMPLVDFINAHPQIDFIVVLKLRTVSAFRRTKANDKIVVQLDVKNKSVELADSSFSDGLFTAREPATQIASSLANHSEQPSRRVAYTRGGIFTL